MVKVLFVCSGNICRSPTAEAVFRALVAEAGLHRDIEVDSAGLGHWHVGEPPDARTREAARRRGYDLAGQRARQVKPADFRNFDYIVAMDRGHLRALAAAGDEKKLSLFLDFTREHAGRDVPDPYYGGPSGFELVLDLVETGARGLLAHIRARHFERT